MTQREIKEIVKQIRLTEPIEDPVYLNSMEAASYLKMGVRTLLKLKEIPRVKVGKHYLYEKSHLIRWVNNL